MRERHWHEECGVFGIVGDHEAASKVYLGLYALQHRGQEAAGIVASDGELLRSVKRLGLVTEAIRERDLRELPGRFAIGHNRYSTTGASDRLANIQPILVDFKGGQIAIAHNGNLVNAIELRTELEQSGALFQSTSDTEVIIHLLARSTATTLEEKLVEALRRVRGAYSLVLMGEKSLIGARDPHGFRPLCLGRTEEGWALASESCALDIIGARYEREVEPGEIVVLNEPLLSDPGVRTLRPFPPEPHRFCVFELVYFSRPDSVHGGLAVDRFRRELGRRLAREHPAPADIVIAVPDSSNAAALGYAEESGLRYELGLIRNHYVGRTFISPSPAMRSAKARIKYNPVRAVLEGKRVVVVDDSIVRGNTSRRLVEMLRGAGAREVHFRVSSPPIRWPCYYGIDTPTREELIASSKTVEEIARFIGADSVAYLSQEGMLSAGGYRQEEYCSACFSGDYPVAWSAAPGKEVFELRGGRRQR